MYRLWETLISPLLEAVRPGGVVEIGIGTGRNTRNLAEFVRQTGGMVYAIDPAPECDIIALERLFAPHLRTYRGSSLDVLPDLPPFDAVVVDGDHNWYTVLHELRAIARHAAAHGTSPLILLHDTGWPYARRDLYYAPERIPEAFRKPHRRGGLVPGRDEPLATGGQNAHLDHADREEAHHAGVMGAIEDFLAQSADISWRFWSIPGFYGLGVLAPDVLIRSKPGFAQLMETCGADRLLARQTAALEQNRLELLCDIGNLRAQAEEARNLRPLVSMVEFLQQQQDALMAERRKLQDALMAGNHEQQQLRSHVLELAGELRRIEEQRSLLAQHYTAMTERAAAYERQNTALLQERTATEAHLRAVEAQSAAQQAKIHRILTSRTWRWTAVLRKALFWLRRDIPLPPPPVQAPARESERAIAREPLASLSTISSRSTIPASR